MPIRELLESTYTWLLAGGIGTIATAVATALLTKSRKKKWQVDAKTEEVEDVLIAVTNLTEMVKFMTEIFIKIFVTNKNIPIEIKNDIEFRLEEMKKKAIFRLSAASEELLKFSKEKKELAKEKSRQLYNEVANETNQVIEEMKNATTKAVGELLK